MTIIKRKYWRGVISNGKGTAYVECPKCGQYAGLSDHEIKEDGTVDPSMVCPNKGCDFHDYVKLEEWKTESPTPLTK